MKKKIAILGSTGSIGKSTLDIIRKDKKNFDVVLLSANNNYKKIIQQAKEFNAKNILINNKLFYNFDLSKYLYSTNNFLLCLEISLVCQLGDLFVSYIKRKAKVKDTGRILPGHGGVLDRVDGIIFAISFVFIYLNGFGEYVEIWIATFSRL